MTRIVFSSLLSIILLIACTPTEERVTEVVSTPGVVTPSLTASSPTSMPIIDQGTQQPTSISVMGTATPDERLDPLDWQKWPITPTRISTQMRELYYQGLAAGNDPHAFSKVGDCQNITNVFLGLFDTGKYTLIPSSSFLEDTIDYYQGSFARESQAVRGGFNAATVLSPLWADVEACNPGETPLDCEIRLHRPSAVLISLETWFPNRTAELYEGYLRQIIDKVIASKAVPLLATKADNAEGYHQINRVIAKLAYEYDLPLWNFWLAVQPLPNHGIDWARDPGGFHITTDGWTVRSFSALWALDSLRKLLAEEHIVITPDPINTQGDDDITSPPELVNIPTGQGALFSMAELENEIYRDSGIYFLRFSDHTVTQVTDEGFRLIDVSPKSDAILVSNQTSLYILALNGDKARLISDQFFNDAVQGGLWGMNPEKLLFIEASKDQNRIVSTETNESDHTLLTDASHHPNNLYAISEEGIAYWEDSNCYDGICLPLGARWASMEGNGSGDIPGAISIAVPRSGDHIAYVMKEEGTYSLMLADIQELPGVEISSGEDPIIQAAWSPDGARLAFLDVHQSDYSGRQIEQHIFLAAPPDWHKVNLSLDQQLISSLRWSPDGQFLWLAEVRQNQDKYEIHLTSVNPTTVSIKEEITLPRSWGGINSFIRHIVIVDFP